jgi:broad specificity phosphatase PhoE
MIIRAARIALWLGFLGTTVASAQATTVILVRHAEKSAPTGDAALTPIGEQRSRDLAQALGNVKLARIITTQYQRTRLTGEPVARAANLEITVVPASRDLKAAAAAVVASLDSLPNGSTALVIGHSNTLGSIISALGGPSLPDLCDGEHSTMFILERPGRAEPVSVVRARYGAAEPPEANQC